MNIKGQDLIDFFREWPPGEDAYMEDVPFSEREDGVLCEADDRGNDTTPVNPEETYKVLHGLLGWQEDGKKPANFDSDFVRVLGKWLKARTTVTLVLEVPKLEKDSAIELLAVRGWRVKS